MERIYTQAMSLKKLRATVERGVFAVPQLQREFVWNARKACDLLDSIDRKFPIGTLLVWKTSRRNEGLLRKTLHILPPFNPKSQDVFFLVDGQQRLSVLWHLMGGGDPAVTNADGKEVDFRCIFFDWKASEDEPSFVYRKRLHAEAAERLVPVLDMLAPRWQQRMGPLSALALRKVEACRERFFKYPALVVFCETSDLAEVRETFVRINSQGMKIGAADRAFARASKFDLRARVREVQTTLQRGFDKISATTILQTVALALGGGDLGDRAIDAMISRIEKSSDEQARFEKVWRVLRHSFALVVDDMDRLFGVPNFGFLPSEPMLTTLALFQYYNGNARPSSAAKRRLVQWFWATAVGARYSGRGYRPNRLADADFVKRLAVTSRAKAAYNVRVPKHMLLSTDYARPGPLSNAFFCLLRSHGPRYLTDGEEIPFEAISARGNRSQKHHVFPRALLHHYGIGPERFNSILNICYLVARENQSVGQKAPRHYLDEQAKSSRVRNTALKSHLIPSASGQGIWDKNVKRGFKAFSEARAGLLIREFEKKAGMQLFERS